ncbi:MAG: type II toxin-antitoxin system RelE/ParE family toxin [Geobacteraceae bacterium]|nr:type II toxin-antitoxin system RelE/ParE family toxin [Geobacteraceae bacterium]
MTVQSKPIAFAESALCDLEDIQHWYAEQLVPDVGERLVRELVAKVEQLVEFPESGRIVPEFGITSLRELIHSPFRLVYRIDPAKIFIVRIWRSERLLKIP